MKTTLGRSAVLFTLIVISLQMALAQNAWKIVDESGEITLISNGRLKQSWGDDALLMDGKKNRILFLSSEKKAYAQGTPEEYCALIKEAQDGMMAKLPPEQRAMLEGMRKNKEGAKPPKVVVKPQGSGGKVSGLETEKYAIYVDGELREEVWLATDVDFVKQFKPLIGIFRGFSQCVGSMSMSMQDEVETSKEYLDLYEKGIEVKARRAGADEEGQTEEESTIERVTVSDSEFAIPSGYKEIDLRVFVYGQMGGMDDE